MNAGQTRILQSLAEISSDYDVLLCDLWGCYHNGVEPYPAAVAALRSFRAAGGAVVLITNAPRPSAPILRHLDRMGAPKDSFDDIVSSGDATRHVVAAGKYGTRVHVVGPERDSGIWDDLPIELTPLEQADSILCTGLFDDETETPADYADLVRRGVALGLTMLCANPDIVVDRAETRLYCAGAIAEAYKQAGGEAVYFGKPHQPIYALALEKARALRPTLDSARILAVGDGVATDVLGAEQAGVDCLFVTGGLAWQEVGDNPDTPEPGKLTQYLVGHGRSPRYAIGRLR